MDPPALEETRLVTRCNSTKAVSPPIGAGRLQLAHVRRRQRPPAGTPRKRAQDLDDMIAKTAKMQKRIVEEIKRIGMRDRLKRQRMTATRKARRRKKPRG